MTTINNPINNLVPKNTILLSPVADQISKKFSVNIASVRNTPSSLNRHGNTFQGMITSSPATRPGAIKNVHCTAAQQITAAKTPLYTPLNRHGNTFQGMITSSPATRHGAIKNVHSTAGSAIDKTSVIPRKDVTQIKDVDCIIHPVNEHLYDLTNEYAEFDGEFNTIEDCEWDQSLFESYTLFSNTPSDPDTGELEISNKPYNSLKNPLAYTQEEDEVVV